MKMTNLFIPLVINNMHFMHGVCFSQLYNSSQLRFSTLKDKCEMGRDIDKMFSDAKQQFGNINLIINSETSLYQGFNNHLENLGNS